MKKFTTTLLLAGLIHLSYTTLGLADMNVDNGDGAADARAQIISNQSVAQAEAPAAQVAVAASE